MAVRPLCLALLGLLALLAHAAAADPAKPPENLAAAMERQKADLAALQAKSAEGPAALRKWYESALDAVKKDALAKGNLDGVLTADTERQRLDRDLTPEEKAKLPPVLQPVRAQYDQARATVAAQQKTASAALLRTYVNTLEDLEKRLTKKADIDGALATRKERTVSAEQLAAAEPIPLSPKPATATPPPSPAVAAVKNAEPARGAPVLDVAAELVARQEPVSPFPQALVFKDTSLLWYKTGGLGLLIKNTPAAGPNGSTWSFNYKRNGDVWGLQLFHPYGLGQIVVTILNINVTVSSPTAMSEAGWKKMKDLPHLTLTEAGQRTFPLKDNQNYAVVSQLSPKGKYSLLIDGEVVATGPVRAAHPIVFDKESTLEGKDVPKRWSQGFAAILVGGANPDRSSNSCSDVKFQASASEPGAAGALESTPRGISGVTAGGPSSVAGPLSSGRKIRVKMQVDGIDEVHVKAGALWIEHKQHKLPSDFNVNGTPWKAEWDAGKTAPFTGFAPALLPFGANVVVKTIKAPGTVTVKQAPADSNDQTLVVEVNDTRSGANAYDFEISW
jgi:hypothetical protein